MIHNFKYILSVWRGAGLYSLTMPVSGLHNPWTHPFAARGHRINSFSMIVGLTSVNLNLGGKRAQTLSSLVSLSVKDTTNTDLFQIIMC